MYQKWKHDGPGWGMAHWWCCKLVTIARLMWSDPLWTHVCLLPLAKCENKHKTIRYGVLTLYFSWVILQQYCSNSKKLHLFSSKVFNWNSFQPLFTNATLYAAIFSYAAFMCNIIPSHHKKLPCINNLMLQRTCKFLPFFYMWECILVFTSWQ